MRKKGFTLVELIAVMVVIALILAIAVPTITGIIRLSAKNAFVSDAKLILRTSELKRLENEEFDVSIITKDNLKNILNLSDENYNSISLTEINNTTFIRVVGQGKWEGLTACGVYKNVKVTDGTKCGLEFDSPFISYEPNGTNNYVKSTTVKITVSDENLDENSLRYVWMSSNDDLDETEYTNLFENEALINMPVDSGIFYLHTIAKDTLNNTAKLVKEFKLDNNAPIITLNGDSSVTVIIGSTYLDDGASAVDNIDDTVSVISSGFINVNQVGMYTITYRAIDAAGNEAIKFRTVNVVDVSSPIITILGDNPLVISVDTIYSDAGATAIDDVDGDITNKIISTGVVTTNIPGTYIISYYVIDMAGNEATAVRTVEVIDDINPTILFGANGNTTYAKSRSTTVTVSDAHSGVNTSSLKYLWNTSTSTPSEGSFTTSFTNGASISSPASATGGYYLWILAKDNAGNTRIQRTNVFNLDNVPPVITLLGTTPVSVYVGSTYSDAGATASDNINGNLTANIVATGSVNVNVAGTYVISYNVSDGAGNSASTVTRTVNVVMPTLAIDNPVSVFYNYAPGSWWMSASGSSSLYKSANEYFLYLAYSSSMFSGYITQKTEVKIIVEFLNASNNVLESRDVIIRPKNTGWSDFAVEWRFPNQGMFPKTSLLLELGSEPSGTSRVKVYCAIQHDSRHGGVPMTYPMLDTIGYVVPNLKKYTYNYSVTNYRHWIWTSGNATFSSQFIVYRDLSYNRLIAYSANSSGVVPRGINNTGDGDYAVQLFMRFNFDSKADSWYAEKYNYGRTIWEVGKVDYTNFGSGLVTLEHASTPPSGASSVYYEYNNQSRPNLVQGTMN